MTINEWQSKPGCVSFASKLLADPSFNQMLEVVESVHPAKQDHIKNLTSQDLLVEHGFIKGFSYALKVFRMLGESKPEFKEPESHFSDTNQE